MKQRVECEMILPKDHLTEVAGQVHPQERPRLVGYPGEMDATLNCTFSFIRQQWLMRQGAPPRMKKDRIPTGGAMPKIGLTFVLRAGPTM
jgi:hypothetical protein